jgi:mRNA interferase RelE/StbE
MKIAISPLAKKQLRKISKPDQIAIGQKIRLLKEESVSLQEEKLQGYNNIFRVRVGDYRIVYKKVSQEIYIILIRHRKDVYRLVKELLG